MKITVEFREKFEKLRLDQRGIFSSKDLRSIISPTSNVDFYRQIKKLVKEKLIFKFCQGIYVSSNFSRPHLIMAINSQATLSLEYALAFYNMIGTYSDAVIRPLVKEVKRPIKTNDLTLEFKKLNEDLFFGNVIEDGVRVATKEKALLDTLYFYQKGTKYYFDIYSDIDISEIDHEKINEYLTNYRNPKFIAFVKEYLNV
jgi:hypothetical protein